MQKEIIEHKETQQLTLLDFNKLAEEIKTLTKEIIKNRWEISNKLFYIHSNWYEYKKDPSFPYKHFKDFVKQYYDWTRNQADNYLDAYKLKLLLENKSKPAYLNNMGITVANKLYHLSELNENKAIKLIEKNPKIDRRYVETLIKELKEDVKQGILWDRLPVPYGDNIFYLSEINHKDVRNDAYHVINDGEPYPTLKRRSWFFHKDGREFSLREYARVQTFPDDFKFIGTKKNIKDQIGNAVAPDMAKHVSKDIPKGNAIELFAGCGGMALGFERNNHKILFMNERDRMACFTYHYNFPNVIISRKDIKKLSIDEIKENIKNKKINLIFGGPPCQGFSLSGNRFKDDPRNKLYKEFIRIVDGIKPKYFILENVMGILPFKEDISKDFNEVGYKVSIQIVKGEEIGMRQHRHRVFFKGVLI